MKGVVRLRVHHATVVTTGNHNVIASRVHGDGCCMMESIKLLVSPAWDGCDHQFVRKHNYTNFGQPFSRIMCRMTVKPNLTDSLTVYTTVTLPSVDAAQFLSANFTELDQRNFGA